MAGLPLRVGIIGGGFGAAVHLPALTSQPGVQVIAIADSGSGKARPHAIDGIEYVDWRALVVREDIDAITVAVPPQVQRNIVHAILSNGQHVFCEKPFGSCLADALAMRDHARASKKVVAVDFQFRFEPGIEALRYALHAGRIGNPRGADVSWITAGRARADVPWSWQNSAVAGGGVIGAYFSHVADILCWLTSISPRAASAHCSVLVPERKDGRGIFRSVTAEDSVTALLEFDRDFVASCRITNCQPGGSGMRIELRGDRGMLVMSHRHPYRHEDCDLVLFPQDGKPESLPIDWPRDPMGADSRINAVSRCLGHFLTAVRGGSVVDLPDADDGVAAQCVMQAVRQSSENHARVRVADLALNLARQNS